MILGENFFPLLILAFGAALITGSVFALIKPPTNSSTSQESKIIDKNLVIKRSIIQIVIGLILTTWSVATLFTG